jgi:hypothetical protein
MHDINATIEIYHQTLMAILKFGKSQIIGCYVGWCNFFYLIGEVIPHYWYHSFCKQHGFVNNKHHPIFLDATLLDAQNILMDIETLPITLGGPTYICFMTRPRTLYIVYNPNCNYVHALSVGTFVSTR